MAATVVATAVIAIKMASIIVSGANMARILTKIAKPDKSDDHRPFTASPIDGAS